MKPQLISLKKYNYGKQIAAIEKLIFTGPQPQQSPSTIALEIAPATGQSTHGFVNPGVNTIDCIVPQSYAATPMLTDGQNSPQSISVPSTSVSTIDEPTESTITTEKSVLEGEKHLPEVVINAD